MENSQFESIFNEVFAACRATLVDRATQYASDDDRLHNFRQAGELMRVCAQQALNGMRIKHEVALNDFIHNWEKHDVEGSPEQWKEKIIDDINYLILLYALNVEDGLI